MNMIDADLFVVPNESCPFGLLKKMGKMGVDICHLTPGKSSESSGFVRAFLFIYLEDHPSWQVVNNHG